MTGLPIADFHGFNYSGSWGTSGLDLWQHHDNGLMAVEVARGKRFFPGWNVARWWLSNEAFQRGPERFLANLEAGLRIFDAHGIRVMPVLFNRWRDPICDFGGVPLDHIIPGASHYVESDEFAAADGDRGPDWKPHAIFRRYLEAVVGAHAADERIVAWDLCNEPLSGRYVSDPDHPLRIGELRWLTWCRDVAKASGAAQPLTIATNAHPVAVAAVEPISDAISVHAYHIPGLAPDFAGDFAHVGSREGYERFLDSLVTLGERTGKPVLASETVWGAIDDAEHVELIRYTLRALRERGIGFIAHALHHSLVADLHAAEYGPVGNPERLEFINADGSLRAGHEAFNEFAPAS
ncbi:MAG TPA: hypothetical protein VFS37_12390 [Conexibacter sp.]|nr:hypothetical protein [Conexibacter sp.]